MWTTREETREVWKCSDRTSGSQGCRQERADYNKVPWTGWLTRQRFISMQFWRPEVQDQGVDKVPSFWELSKIISSLSPSFRWFSGNFGVSRLVEAWPNPCLPLHILFSQCACLCVQISPLNKDTSHLGLGPTLMTSSEQRPCFRIRSRSEILEIGSNAWNLVEGGGDHKSTQRWAYCGKAETQSNLQHRIAQNPTNVSPAVSGSGGEGTRLSSAGWDQSCVSS